jgi:hypothetical protein
LPFQSRDAAVAETERIRKEDVSSLQQKVEMLEDQLKKTKAQFLLEAEKVYYCFGNKIFFDKKYPYEIFLKSVSILKLSFAYFYMTS